MVRTKSGWQCKVFLYKNHVIKKPLAYKEIRNEVHYWLKKSKGKSEKEISKVARECFYDIQRGKKIIQKSHIPLKYLGNPIFYKDGTMKQDRVVILAVRIHNLLRKGREKDAEKVIDKFFDFIKLLWSYGISEKPYKMNKNFGITRNGNVILLDLFEITDNYEDVKRSLKWARDKSKEPWSVKKHMLPYYNKVAPKTFNVNTLNRYWKKNLKR